MAPLAIFQGQSTLASGREGDESAQGGVEVEVKAGDVIVVPAGVSHRSLSAENYRYIGVYPKVLFHARGCAIRSAAEFQS